MGIGIGAALVSNIWIQFNVSGIILQMQARVIWSSIGIIASMIGVFVVFGIRPGSSPTRGGLAGFAAIFSAIDFGYLWHNINVIVEQTR